jgi:hypothetical protein
LTRLYPATFIAGFLRRASTRGVAVAKMLVYCDYSVGRDIHEAWMLYRIPDISEAEIIDAQIECLRIISHHCKKDGFKVGHESWFVFRVLQPFDTEWPNILAHVPDIEEGLRWSLKTHKKAG